MQGQKGVSFQKYAVWLILAAVFAMTFAVCRNVRLYGDDFFYKSFTSFDTRYFVSHHIEHYFRANGRVIVHLLVTLFLGADPICWQILNPLMLCAVVYAGAKTAAGEDGGPGTMTPLRAAVMAVSVFFLRPRIIRQSVYWLTGSFNYVYPVMMLFVYWHMLSRGRRTGEYSRALPALAFFAAATVEQSSMMAFGLTVIAAFDSWVIRREKMSKPLFFALVGALLGMLTVLLAPGVFHRSTMEIARNAGMGFLALLKMNMKIQGQMLFFSREMILHNTMALVSALFTLGSDPSEKGHGLKRVFKPCVMVIGSLSWLLMIWEVFIVSSADGFKGVTYARLFLYLAAVLGFVATLFYGAFCAYRRHPGKGPGFIVPMTALILGYGSQLMMLVSHVYGARNLIFAIFMLALYTAALTPHVGALKLKALKYAFAGLCAVLAAWSCVAVADTAAGYAQNVPGYENNLALAGEYREKGGGGVLIQYELTDAVYGWAMPYHNPYYDPYYKIYLGVSDKTEIEWR